jgi:hypothetical protein
LALDPQTKVEIDELITFVQTSGVPFIRNGQEYCGAEGADHLGDKLAKAGDRVKTTDDFITGIASKSYVELQLIEIPPSLKALKGVVMELPTALRESADFPHTPSRPRR